MSTDKFNNINATSTPSEISRRVGNARPGLLKDNNMTLAQIEALIAALHVQRDTATSLVKQQAQNGQVPPQEIERIVQAVRGKIENKIKELEEKREKFVALANFNTTNEWKLKEDSWDGINKGIELGSLDVYKAWGGFENTA